ncbi:hypothetical protein BOTNAR_0583g00050 [Botryotinia narcissicola]|uniref:Uncharacterized protein n=1 Tax=Botryotinia narcissicola TaxID=278944 RepID=A0A4Z1HCD1_9HELO|nr:hypothetical protein BOTNAR_0583g00050 [Botryotinia narcissicola]
MERYNLVEHGHDEALLEAVKVLCVHISLSAYRKDLSKSSDRNGRIETFDMYSEILSRADSVAHSMPDQVTE